MSSSSLYRAQLPQLHGVPLLADGGMETTLVFHDGIELPLFASFPLLESAAGKAALLRYFESYIEVARKHGAGLVLESATWRANPDWAAQLGYDADQLARCNREAIELLVTLRDEHAPSLADRDQRQRRPARRRLQPGREDDRPRRPRPTTRADRRLRRDRAPT